MASRISFSAGYSVLNPLPPKICTASVADWGGEGQVDGKMEVSMW